MKDEVMKALEENRLYDYIANNYWNMSNEVLKDILLEAIWVGCQNAPRDEDYNKKLIDELNERWNY